MSRHRPAFYHGAEEQDICEALAREGYCPQRIEEPPYAVYDAHRHLTDLVLAFTRGSAEVRIGDRFYDCRAGDRLVVPGNIEHSAKIGAEGVVYLMTEVEVFSD